MKKFKKHTPEQIVRKLEQAEKLKAKGATTAQILAELQISQPTLTRWKREYGDMNRKEAKELKRLRDENDELKRLLGQSELEKRALRLIAEGKHLKPNPPT